MPTRDSFNKKKHKSRSKQPPKKGASDQPRPSDKFIYGMHSVQAALENPDRVIHRVRASRNAAIKLQSFLGERKISADVVDIKELDKVLGPDVVHQGVLLEVDPLPLLELDELDGRSPILVLDQVTDPHNVGAIIRSAAAFGVGALVMTARNSPPLAGVLAKTASGGLEHVPVCLVGNLSRALEELGQAGYWRLGLDGEGEACLEDIEHTGPTALVLGAEGKGLRRLSKENCDQIVRIKTASSLRSLNVSNAAAVALHSVHMTMK
ncbi:MAG: 23S rRNA (guanosine(2251)-2'-O)-methyltransferase RlmB [Methyloligellaceae bacterium]